MRMYVYSIGRARIYVSEHIFLCSPSLKHSFIFTSLSFLVSFFFFVIALQIFTHFPLVRSQLIKVFFSLLVCCFITFTFFFFFFH